jgi:tellurite methyltransferase
MLNWFLILFISFSAYARTPISGKRLEQLTGVSSSKSTKNLWDSRYSRRNFVYGKTPAKFLSDNYSHIKYGGKVLDMGMGEGRNAVFLAQKGYQVIGVDISSVAVKKSNLLAKEFGVNLKTIVASLKKYNFRPGTFDAIINFYWVDRSMVERIRAWLKPEGILFYEAYTNNQSKVDDAFDESNGLVPGELLKMFPAMKVLKFEEPLHKDDFTASIILKK